MLCAFSTRNAGEDCCSMTSKSARSGNASYVFRRYGDVNSVLELPLLDRAVMMSTAEVIEYLVYNCSMWTFTAFENAVLLSPVPSHHPDAAKKNRENLEICRVLYAAAKMRALATGMPVIKVLTRGRLKIRILDVANAGCFEKAAWLAECVPEIHSAKKIPSNFGFNSPATSGDPRLAPVVLALLRHRPEQCKSLHWMPEWAVRADCREAIVLLDSIRHHKLYTHATLNTICSHLRNGDAMLRVIARVRKYPADRVVYRAATHSLVPVLQCVYNDQSVKGRRGLLSVARDAADVAVLEWVYAQQDPVPLSPRDIKSTFTDGA